MDRTQIKRNIAISVAIAVAWLAGAGPAPALMAPGGISQGLTYHGDGSIVSSDFVLGPTAPGKWGAPAIGTPGGVVTWSLMPTGTSCAAEFAGCTITALADFMPAGFKPAIEAAFAAWSAVANITFVEVLDNGFAFNAAGAVGDIRLGGHAFDGPGGVLAHAFFPPVNGVSAAGDIHFDIAETWKIGFGGPGFDVFQVTAHEVGHSIGLDHTGVPGSLMGPFYTEAFSGPQADDIAGAQFIYGAAIVPGAGSLVLVVVGFGAVVAGLRRRGGPAGG
jgi:hypothetical protein